MRPTIVALLILLVATPVVAAGEKSFETRWHEAYVLEVIEGRVDEAARQYLELMVEETLPAELARETRFRFAVCCALLGRADEARSRLAGLAVEPDLPEAFRARVDEYRRALDGVGAGREVDRRARELVLELGNLTTVDGDHAQYRAFLILGKPAIAALEPLLRQTDVVLRAHAYRILCRLDAPVIATTLPPQAIHGGYVWRDLGDYLRRHPDRRATLERLVLEQIPDGIDPMVLFHRIGRELIESSGLSEAFILELAKRRGAEKAVALALDRASWSPELRTAVLGWIREGRAELAVPVAETWLRLIRRWPDRAAPSDLLDPRVFSLVVTRVGEISTESDISRGLRRYADAMPREVVYETMERLTAAAEQKKTGLPDRTLGQLAFSFYPIEVDDQPERLAAFVRRWAALGEVPTAGLLPSLFAKLAAEEGQELVRATFGGPLPGQPWSFLAWRQASDVACMLAVMDSVDEENREKIVWQLRTQARSPQGRNLTDEFCTALVEVFPELLSRAATARWEELVEVFAVASTRVSAEVALESFVRAVQDVADLPERERESALNDLFLERVPLGIEDGDRFHREIRAPALGKLREPISEHPQLLEVAWYLLASDGNPGRRIGGCEVPGPGILPREDRSGRLLTPHRAPPHPRRRGAAGDVDPARPP
jgi:hypothetical protein